MSTKSVSISELREAVVLDSDVTESADGSETEINSNGDSDIASDDEFQFGKTSVKINLNRTAHTGDHNVSWTEATKAGVELDLLGRFPLPSADKHRRAKSANSESSYVDASWFALRKLAFERTEHLLRESLDKQRKQPPSLRARAAVSDARFAHLDSLMGSRMIRRIDEYVRNMALKECDELNAEYDEALRTLPERAESDESSEEAEGSSGEASDKEASEQQTSSAEAVAEPPEVNRSDAKEDVAPAPVDPRVTALLAEIDAVLAHVRKCATETISQTHSTLTLISERQRVADRSFGVIANKLDAVRSSLQTQSGVDLQKLLRECVLAANQIRDNFADTSEQFKAAVQRKPTSAAAAPAESQANKPAASVSVATVPTQAVATTTAPSATAPFKPATTVAPTQAVTPTVTPVVTPTVTPSAALGVGQKERLFNVLVASTTPYKVDRRPALCWAQAETFADYAALMDRVSRYFAARARFADDARNRQMRFDVQKAINTPVNALTPDNVDEKISTLTALFGKMLANEELRLFAFDTLASIVFRIASEQMSVASANSSVAMEHSIALGTCVKQLLFTLSDAHRDELIDLLRFRLVKECVYFAPIDVRRVDADKDSQAADSMLLLLALGYRPVEQETETTDSFLKRLVGSARLFAALCIAESHDERADKTEQLSPAAFWRWLAAVANLELRANGDLVAHLLVETLELAWYTLEQFYGAQYFKLIGALKRFGRTLEMTAKSRAPLVRLSTFLERDASSPSS